MVVFQFGKKKHSCQKKRFAGEALQWYFTSTHLSSWMAYKRMALVLVFRLQTTLSCLWQLQRPGLEMK